MPILLATSRASQSAVNFTYAFFCPSGLLQKKCSEKLVSIIDYEVDVFCKRLDGLLPYLMRVFTLSAVISYNFLTASLICFLLAVSPTMKTKVLLSSIFFIADSVVRGNLMMS